MPTTWCDQSDIELILSNHGVESYADDDEDGSAESGIVTAAIERSSALHITPFIEERYAPLSVTSSNSYLRWANAVLAVFELCTRRNLPAPQTLETYRGEIHDMFIMVMQGRRKLPEQDEATITSGFMTNYQIQRGRSEAPARVDQSESVGGTPHHTRRRRASSDWYRYF